MKTLTTTVRPERVEGCLTPLLFHARLQNPFVKLFSRFFALFGLVMMLGVTNANSADMCYDTPVSSGGIICLGIIDIGGCKLTTPIRNISSSPLTDVTVIKAYQGIDLSLLSGIGIDGDPKSPNIGDDEAEVTDTLNQYTNFNGFVDFNIFNKGVVYRTDDYAPSTPPLDTSDQHTIYTQSLIGISFSSLKYIAEYTKDGTVYNTRIYPCDTKLVSITPQNQSIVEGNSGTTAADFNVTLSSKPTKGDLKVNYTITEQTATQASDYSAPSYIGTLTFNKNTPNLTQTISTSIIGDTSIEDNETYVVTLTSLSQSSGENFIIDESFKKGVTTILNDDIIPEIGWEQLTYETSENTALTYGDSSQMPMRITIDHAVDYPISVSFATHNGTAIGDSDYRTSSGTVTIPAGETSVTINMDIYHDEAIELTENFTVTLTNPTGSGGVTLKTGYDVATVRIMEQNTAPMCYSDNFSGTLDDKWRTLYSNGTFTPQINSGHLKLTPGKKNIATAVTKDYEFPSSENLIIVEFQHYAYGGCFEESPAEAGLGDYGADGIVAVLYDSAVGATPTVGGYGGSMGYAQRTDNVADGFQGGWLGLGLDEYGNFANPTEGRVGGPGFHTNAAVIRGDGVGLTGYEFLAEAYPLATSIAPLVDYTNPLKLPGDKFRMTVDARDTAHLYIRLERDTGTGYVTIINQFDAKNPVYNQTTTPEMVRFALTAGTGGGCNAHEIDELTVWGRCQPYNPALDLPPHTGFDAREPSILMADNNRSITTKISNKPFQLNVVSLDENGTLAPYGGVSYNRVYLFAEENATCSLPAPDRLTAISSKARDWYVTFNQLDENKITQNKTILNASQDKRIMMNFIDWNQAFTDASFNCSNSNTQAVLKGVPQCLNSNTKITTVFPTLAATCLGGLRPACESNSYAASGLPSAPYNNDYGCYQCLAGGAGKTVCSTDNFAVRPERLAINSIDTAMPNLLRSAQDYNVSINAYNYNTTTNTLDYNVTGANAVFDINVTKYMKNNDINNSMAGAVTFSASDFNMSNGYSVKSGVIGNEVAGITFDDVGKINIKIQDKIWSAVDNDDTPMSCDANGTYLCGDKNVTFIPDHFDFNELNITNNNGNPGSFTYIANEVGQMAGRIHTKMRALNKSGNETRNFATYPLWENNVTVTPVVVKSTYLYPDANETNITSLSIGFSDGNKTITRDETNTSQYLRFNFRRDVNQTANPFDVSGTDLNISMVSHYVDAEDGDTADINGSRLGTGIANLPYTVLSPADGNTTMVYGRVIPRDIRVFGANKAFTANAWYEVYNASTLGGTSLPASRNDAMWYINVLHSDTAATYDGDANVTVVNTTAVNIGGAVGTDGMEDYNFGNTYDLGGYKAHINTDPWLWYGVNALGYADPGMNVDGTTDGTVDANDCIHHPCFNITVVPPMGATGSAKSTNEATKESKKSDSGGGAWKSTSDYAPAIR